MRRLIIPALLLACLCGGQVVGAVVRTKLEQITIDGVALGRGFTPANINASGSLPAMNSAVCRLETNEIRYTYTSDLTVVSTTSGILLEVGETLYLTGNDILNNFRAVTTGGSNGKLDCIYSS